MGPAGPCRAGRKVLPRAATRDIRPDHRGDPAGGRRLPVRRAEAVRLLRGSSTALGCGTRSAATTEVVSARRAHGDETLLRAAAVPGIRALLYEPRGTVDPFCTTLRPVVGIRPHLQAPLRLALERAARRLGGPEQPAGAGR